MSKYNISEKTPKQAFYRTQVNATLMDELKEKILDIILIRQKYKDKNYSAKQLAIDLGTNTRDMVGFANRQSFYASFYKLTGMTPKQYKKMNYMKEEDKKK